MTTVIKNNLFCIRYQFAKIISTFSSIQLKNRCIVSWKWNLCDTILDLDGPREPVSDGWDFLIVDSDIQD
jgi:hypothetical protein